MSVCINANRVHSTGKAHECAVCDLCFVCHGCPNVDYTAIQPHLTKLDGFDVLGADVQNLIRDIEGDEDPRYIIVGPNNEIQDKSATIVYLNKKNDTKKHILTYTCAKCFKEFDRKHDLDIHEIYHATEDEHVCQICHIRFNYSYELIKHMINHKDPCYVCPYCKREFSTEIKRKLHTRKHTGEKLFDCEICGKSFLEKATLKSHELTHTDIRPYSCSECGRAFRSKFKLDRHNWIHEGIKPFVCHVCEKQFRYKCNLKSHLQQHMSDDEDIVNDCFVDE